MIWQIQDIFLLIFGLTKLYSSLAFMQIYDVYTGASCVILFGFRKRVHLVRGLISNYHILISWMFGEGIDNEILKAKEHSKTFPAEKSKKDIVRRKWFIRRKRQSHTFWKKVTQRRYRIKLKRTIWTVLKTTQNDSKRTPALWK